MIGRPSLVAAAIAALLASTSDALTIVRVGGADHPPPDLASEPGVEFVQLPWAAVEKVGLVSSAQMDVDPGFLEPTLLPPDVNLAPTFRQERGRIRTLDWIGWTLSNASDDVMWDGDTTTVYLGDGHWTAHGTQYRDIIFEFNGVFVLDRIRWYPRERHLGERFMESFRVGINDGDAFKDGTRDFNLGTFSNVLIDFDLVVFETENSEGVVEVRLPPKPIKQLLLEFRENKRGFWEIAELEIYGRGRAPSASYQSQVIDLGRPMALGNMTWGGQLDDGARMGIAVRAGDDEDPNLYWRNTFRGDEVSRFTSAGEELTLARYSQLKATEQAGITHDTRAWGAWSTAADYRQGTAAAGTSKPRQFIQVQVDIASTLEATGRLDYIQFEASEPLASSAVAEISPTAVVPGVPSDFTYKILPTLQATDAGFDHIAVQTPTRPGGVSAVRQGGVEIDFELVRLDSTGFELRIPRVDVGRTHELIEIDFSATVYRYGTPFHATVYDGDRPLEVRQSVVEGDADSFDDSNTFYVVFTAVDVDPVKSLTLSPAVLTPNGDGHNDVLAIEAEFLNLTGDVPLRVDLLDLSGRPLHRIEGVANSGVFRRTWDGRDASGMLLPPGAYLARIQVDTDAGDKILIRSFSVAY
jgi:hypothetical protein